MKRVVLVACLAAGLAASLQACTRPESGLSLLGMSPASDDASDAAAPAAERPELRHVGSNKVLGAMAFQKVTGRAVDPSRLDGSR